MDFTIFLQSQKIQNNAEMLMEGKIAITVLRFKRKLEKLKIISAKTIFGQT